MIGFCPITLFLFGATHSDPSCHLVLGMASSGPHHLAHLDLGTQRSTSSPSGSTPNARSHMDSRCQHRRAPHNHSHSTTPWTGMGHLLVLANTRPGRLSSPTRSAMAHRPLAGSGTSIPNPARRGRAVAGLAHRRSSARDSSRGNLWTKRTRLEAVESTFECI